MRPIQLAMQNASGKARSANGSYLENWYVQAVPTGSKSPTILVGTPGSYTFCTLPTGPVLDGLMMAGTLYVVTPTKLYSVTSTGTVTELGTVSFAGRVKMATNGTYLVVVGGNGYYYSVSGGLAQFSGGGWIDCYCVKFLDGYFVFSAVPDSDIYFISGLNAVTLDASEASYAESLPDEIRATETLGGELWHFGGTSTEVHYNSADPDFPFDKRQGVLVEKGIGAAHTLVKDDTLFWLGNDRIFYMAEGYFHRRVSDHNFEESISVGDVSDAHAYIYTEEGHKFIVVTFPTLEITWALDLSTGLWARRSHIAWSGRHHGNCFMNAYEMNMIGDFQSGNIYVLTLQAPTDSGDSIIRDVIAPVIHADREHVTMKALEVKMNSGSATESGAGSDPQAQMRYSDDGQNSWSNWKYKSIGRRGEYLTRVRWNRLGQFRERHVHIRVAEPIRNMVVDGLYADFS